MNNKKGQSAMEYLMTYGWALLVIVIVIAVLMFIRPFGAPESCVFQQPGFSCEGHRMTDDGKLFAKIVNGQQKAIKDVEFACVQGSQRPSDTSGAWKSASDSIQHGAFLEDVWLNGAQCKLADGSSIVVNTGDDFTGRFYIKYHYTDDPSTGSFPKKVTYANVIAPVQ